MTALYSTGWKSFFIYFFVHFCGNPGSKVASGVRDSNPPPSDLQPDAMTIRHTLLFLYIVNFKLIT